MMIIEAAMGYYYAKQIEELVLVSKDTGYKEIEQIKSLQRLLIRRMDIHILADDDDSMNLDSGGNDYQYYICCRLRHIVPLVSMYFRLTRYTFHSPLIQSSCRAFSSNMIFICQGSVYCSYCTLFLLPLDTKHIF